MHMNQVSQYTYTVRNKTPTNITLRKASCCRVFIRASFNNCTDGPSMLSSDCNFSINAVKQSKYHKKPKTSSPEKKLLYVCEFLRQWRFCQKDWTSFKTTYIVIKCSGWMISLLPLMVMIQLPFEDWYPHYIGACPIMLVLIAQFSWLTIV